MPHRLLTALSFLLLLLTGCLEFDGQELTLRYDAERDRIDALIVYRGLFAEGGNGSSEKPLDKARQDLADALETGECAFWNNWPLSVNLTADRPAPIRALMQHVDVENGGLFTDPRGVLCGWQLLRIRDAKQFVQKVNTLLELALQAGIAKGFDLHGPDHHVDDDTKDFLREFLRRGEKLLTVEPGHIELRLPCSGADHRWLKDQLERHFLANMPREIVRRTGVEARRAAGGAATDTSIRDDVVQLEGTRLRDDVRRSPSYRFFWDNELSIVREPELTRVAFGVAGDDELRITKAEDGLYHDALLTALRQDGAAIEDGIPDQELQRRFAAFRERQPVLPPKLAALRGTAGVDESVR